MTLWLPVGFFGSAAVFFAVLLVRAILADLRERGEVADTFDDHADEAIALLGEDFAEWEKELSKR